METVSTFSKDTMCYLEEQKIVHRDVSLRNFLARQGDEHKYFVKVSDFGMSRITDTGYYKTDDKTMPVKWTAPEALEYGRFTSKADVWSFGVLF